MVRAMRGVWRESVGGESEKSLPMRSVKEAAPSLSQRGFWGHPGLRGPDAGRPSLFAHVLIRTGILKVDPGFPLRWSELSCIL